MLYSILCYDREDVVGAWTKEQDALVMTKLRAALDELEGQGRLGPVVRLMPTTTATTLRKGRDAVVLDGPFAETKEQLLGVFVVDCPSLEQAIEAAKSLASCYTSKGAYEIRPIAHFRPGSAVK
jgi:hypothetical protein